MKLIVVTLLALAFLTVDASERSSSAVREFKRTVACPETGVTRGACPGWQVDHVVALCAGGEDAVCNMQWLTVEDHKAKTRVDVRSCRALRKGRH